MKANIQIGQEWAGKAGNVHRDTSEHLAHFHVNDSTSPEISLR